MANVVVVGAQWGDEGKGKIVDWLSVEADVVVRFQGGHNAGHTLVIGGETYKLSLLPSGVVRPGKLAVIGNGVVLDPHALVDEIGRLKGQGVAVSRDNLRIADNATLILSLHRELDALRESGGAGTRIGTTRRGIGPAYEDKVGRRAIRLMDLADLDTLPAKIERLLAHHNVLRRGFGLEEFDAGAVFEELASVAPQVLPYRDTVWRLLDEERRAGRRILFEGAQGALLDVDHGTYPFVTSSNTVAGQAATGSGLGPGAVGYVLGIAKAYTTRVGEGPFPTELFDETGERIGTRGREFGTVTGRKRRCGWFDAVLVRQTVRTSGIDGIALTKLDVLDGFDAIRVCIGYDLDGQPLDHLPASQGAQARVKPVYEEIEGWRGSTAGARSWAELPAQAIKYVRRIEELIGAPGRPALHFAGAGRYDSRAKPLRGLTERAATGHETCSMADYYPLISRALDGLSDKTPDMRRAVYERARGALMAQLQSLDPPLPAAEITRERLALDEAIDRIEAEYALGEASFGAAGAEPPAAEPHAPPARMRAEPQGGGFPEDEYGGDARGRGAAAARAPAHRHGAARQGGCGARPHDGAGCGDRRGRGADRRRRVAAARPARRAGAGGAGRPEGGQRGVEGARARQRPPARRGSGAGRAGARLAAARRRAGGAARHPLRGERGGAAEPESLGRARRVARRRPQHGPGPAARDGRARQCRDSRRRPGARPVACGAMPTRRCRPRTSSSSTSPRPTIRAASCATSASCSSRARRRCAAPRSPACRCPSRTTSS